MRRCRGVGSIYVILRWAILAQLAEIFSRFRRLKIGAHRDSRSVADFYPPKAELRLLNITRWMLTFTIRNLQTTLSSILNLGGFSRYQFDKC